MFDIVFLFAAKNSAKLASLPPTAIDYAPLLLSKPTCKRAPFSFAIWMIGCGVLFYEDIK